MTNLIKTINFTKRGTVEILKAFGVKTGLKQIDDWLTTGNGDPEKNTANDFIFRVKVEPFELNLQGEKRKIEVMDLSLLSLPKLILSMVKI